MAEKPLPETDLTAVIRLLQTDAGSGTSPDLIETQGALNLLISEINGQPAGAVAADLLSALNGLFFLQTSLDTEELHIAKTALNRRTVGDLMTRDPWTAPPDQTLSELVNRLFLARAISFAPVLENGKLLGYVDSHMVQGIEQENWASTTVDDVIETVGPDNTVSPDLLGDDLIVRIARTGRRKFLVVLENALVGVVTLSDLISCVGLLRLQLHLPPSNA